MAMSLPPGAKVLPLDAPAQPPRSTRETFSRASPALVKLRVQRLLPETTALAQQRIQALKTLYRTPLPLLKRGHDAAVAASVRRLRLAKSVRNVRIVNSNAASRSGAAAGGGGSNGSSVVGALCMPFSACCALPADAAAASDMSLVATGAVDGLVTVWDVHACTALVSASSCDGNRWGRVRSLAACNSARRSEGDGCLFFSTTMFDRRIGVWAVDKLGETGRAALTRVDTAAPTMAAASEENRHIANINQLAVDPTGSLLASTSDDATLRLWDVRTLTDVVWSASSPAERPSHAALDHLATQDGYAEAGPVLGVAFHPDGSLVSTSDAGGRVVTWDTRTGRHAFTTATAKVGGHLSRATCVAWSPCGLRLASGGADTVMQLWDARMLHRAHTSAAPGERATAPFQLLGHEDVVTSVSFYKDPLPASPAHVGDGRNGLLPVALVSTSLDGTVRLWDMDTGLCAHTLRTDAPVYNHCRPVAVKRAQSGANEESADDADESAAEPANTPAAIFTIGHAKYWSLWDVTSATSFASSEGGAPAVTETETLVDTQHPHTSVAVAEHNEEEDEDDDDEDEMAALMTGKNSSMQAAPVTSAPHAPVDDSDEDDDDDDEMEMLKKKLS